MLSFLPWVSVRPSSFPRLSLRLLLSCICITPALLLVPATRALAQDAYTVTVNTDDPAGVAANCPVNGAGAACTLRDAVAAANADSAGSTIGFSVTGTITISASPIVLSPIASVAIAGPGQSILTISGNRAVTPLGIATSAAVSISGLTFADGYDAAYFNGGAIVVADGAVTIANTAFLNNAAAAGYSGGAIYNQGALTLSGVTFTGNSATNGGAVSSGGSLTVIRTTFSGNTASLGGAVYNSSGSAQIIDSTFSGNSAAAQGGGLFNNSGASAAVSDSTFAANASPSGIAIYNAAGTLTVNNSILTGAADCSGAGCPLDGSSGNVVGNPSLNLSALDNWGGPTPAYLPLAPSSAICAGLSSLLPLDPSTGATLATDQRGFPLNTSCIDAGAVQTNYLTVATTSDTYSSGASCIGGGSSCSLRDAIYLANQAGFADIDFAPGVTGTITMSPDSAVEPDGQINILGPGAQALTLAGDGTDPVFVVIGQVNVSGLTVTGGANPAGTGGGILDSGILTLSNVAVTGNAATGGLGGGIWVNVAPAALILRNTTVSNNSASDGGGIYNDGPVTISDSTIAGNTASDLGGGIFNGTGPILATNTTISANTAATGSGGVYQNAPFTFLNSIVSGNTASSDADIGGTVAYSASSSQIANPLVTLAPLGAYGGSTPTMIPLPGSAAICAGSVALLPPGPATDQRGYPNVNSSYTGSPCVDTGAVQTNYTGVQWAGATAVGSAPSTPTYFGNAGSVIGPPAVTAAVLDNGVISVPGIPVTLSVTGPVAATIDTNPVTTTAAGAAFSVTPGQSGVYTASVNPISVYGSYSVADSPDASLVISAAGTATATTVSAASAPLGAPTVTLSASVAPTGGGAAVNEGSVAFTVSSAGRTIGSSVSSPVSGGLAAAVFAIPAGTSAGAYTITAQYSDTAAPGALYLSSTGAGALTIGKETPSVTAWPTAAAINYGQTLASSALTGGTASVPGAFAFTTPSTAPPVGTASQSVTFTPTDTADYSNVVGSVSVTVNAQSATVTAWPLAAAISYGQTLASSALTGGTASVPGAFAFTAPSTAPPVGTASQSVTFSPTDTTDYSPVTGTVSVTVDKATATVTLSGLDQSYTGSSVSASASTVPAGLTVTFTYNGSSTAPTAVGSYAVVATVGDPDYQGSATGTLSIGKAGAGITLGSLDQAYTGSPRSATATTVPAGLPVTFTYNGGSSAPTPAGSYTVVGTINDPSYSGSATGTMVIGKGALALGAQASPAAGVYGSPVTLLGTAAPPVTEATAPSFSFVIDAGTSGAFAVPAASYQSGTVTATDASLMAGPHTVTLSFAGTADYAAAAGSATPFSVGQAVPSVSWVSTASLPYGSSLGGLLDATARFNSSPVPGSWSYLAQRAGGAAFAVSASTVLAPGTYTLTAAFTPTDTVDYRSVASSAQLTVTGGTLTVSAASATRVYGTANPPFTGSIAGAANGDIFTESFTTTAVVASSAGQYAIVPSAAGPHLGSYSIVVNNGTLTVTKAGTSTSLAASGASLDPGSAVTLSATVGSATSGAPTGTVSFYDGSTLLDKATLSGGSASYSTTSLAAGTTHRLTAVYSGDGNFLSSTSTTTTTVAVAPLDFTLSASPASQVGAAGSTVSYQLALAPIYGSYPGAVQFSASGLPQGDVATFAPATLAANAGPQSVTMSIQTAATASAASASGPDHPLVSGSRLAPIAFALLLLPLFGAGSLRRHGRRFGALLGLLLLAFAGIAATTALTGCGAHYSAATPTGPSYTITVTATSGAVHHSSTVTLGMK